MSHDTNEHTEDHRPADTLDAASQGALDALLEQGLDPDDPRLHDSPVGRLMSLLGTPVAGENDPGVHDALIGATVLRARRAMESDDPVLSARDADALDAMALTGYDASRTPHALRDRAVRHGSLIDAVTDVPVSDADRESLVARTLAHVQGEIDARERSMRLDDRAPRGFRLRLADVVSVAAVLLIGASIVMPVLSYARSGQQRLACETNMRQTASAMGIYAGSNHAALPVATAGFSGGTWIDVGADEPGHSNSANLYTLVRTGHAGLDDLACPGNALAARGTPDPDAVDWRSLPEVSYSYQIMARYRPTWDPSGRQVILADRSPVVLRIVAGRPIVPEGSSPNHTERGQHVLYNDGSAEWAPTPVLKSGDNIWLPRAIENRLHEVRERLGIMNGTEPPSEPGDVFLGP